MPALARSLATLRIHGKDLIPTEVTRLLGCAPTRSWAMGARAPSGLPRTSGHWSLEAAPAQPEDVDGQVAQLLAQVTGDLGVWRSITAQYAVDLFCGWFMGDSNEGVALSVATMRALADRGIPLSLDIYADDAPPSD